MPYAEDLIERLLNHWRETGSTIAVEAAAAADGNQPENAGADRAQRGAGARE